jgi:hypothetical protein
MDIGYFRKRVLVGVLNKMLGIRSEFSKKLEAQRVPGN